MKGWFTGATLGRLALRSGENVPAHAGTVTLRTSKVGLDRESTLNALQAELGEGAPL